MLQGSTRFLAAALWIGTASTFALGMYFPIMATKTQVSVFVLSYEELRVLDTVMLFWQDREYFLSIVILVFALCLPIMKYVDLLGRGCLQSNSAVFRFLHVPDKWSMLDVFLVAILLVNFKLNSSFVVVELKSGVFYLTLSILLRMGLAELLDRAIRRTQATS